MSDWKKLKDKLPQGQGGPSPRDWEAMQAKIAAEPKLSASGLSGAYRLIIALLAGALISSGIWYWASLPSDEPASEMNRLQQDSSVEAPRTMDAQESKFKDSPKEVPVEQPDALNGKAAYSTVLQTTSTTEIVKTDAGAKTSSAEPVDYAQSSKSVEQGKADPILDESRSMASSDAIASRGNAPDVKVADQVNGTLDQFDSGPTQNSITAVATETPQQIEVPQALDSIDYRNSVDNVVKDFPPTAVVEQEDKADASPAAASAEEFIPKESGFIWRSLDFKLPVITDAEQTLWATGLGVGGQWHKGRQRLGLGLNYLSGNQRLAQELVRSGVQIDSNIRREISTRTEWEVTRVWVIDSAFSGRYVYDSTAVQVTDTSYVLQIDSNPYQTKVVNQVNRRLTWVEMPITYGYEWQIGRTSLQTNGGIILQQILSTGAVEGKRTKRFGTAFLLNVEMAYPLSTRWYLSAGLQSRYQWIEPIEGLNTWKYAFQLGVSYRW